MLTERQLVERHPRVYQFVPPYVHTPPIAPPINAPTFGTVPISGSPTPSLANVYRSKVSTAVAMSTNPMPEDAAKALGRAGVAMQRAETLGVNWQGARQREAAATAAAHQRNVSAMERAQSAEERATEVKSAHLLNVNRGVREWQDRLGSAMGQAETESPLHSLDLPRGTLDTFFQAQRSFGSRPGSSGERLTAPRTTGTLGRRRTAA